MCREEYLREMKKIKLIQSYYENNMKDSAYDYQVLGWESQEAQEMRFEMLTSNIDLHGKRLLDVGCGLGNLLEHIHKKGLSVEYTGVDVLPEMIERAKRKNLGGDFIHVDIFKQNPFRDKSFDIIYASGIFNLNLGNNREFLNKALELFFKLSTQYVCFNLLHCKSPAKEDTYHYFCPEEALEIIEAACGNCRPEVRIIEEYLKNDFTLMCKITR